MMDIASPRAILFFQPLNRSLLVRIFAPLVVAIYDRCERPKNTRRW